MVSTEEMSWVMSLDTVDISADLRLASWTSSVAWAMLVATSRVTEDCSSMAAAMVETMVFTSLMTSTICPMSLTALPVAPWMPPMRSRMSLVASAVLSASSLISLATTAKPRPASPARAASMVAFRARRLVWEEMAAMVSVTLPISWAASPSCLRTSAKLFTRWAAPSVVPRARSVLSAISPMVDVISSVAAATEDRLDVVSSMPAATEEMLELISSAAVATVDVLAERERTFWVVWVLTAESSVAEEATVWALPAMAAMIFCSFSTKVLKCRAS